MLPINLPLIVSISHFNNNNISGDTSSIIPLLSHNIEYKSSFIVIVFIIRGVRIFVNDGSIEGFLSNAGTNAGISVGNNANVIAGANVGFDAIKGNNAGANVGFDAIKGNNAGANVGFDEIKGINAGANVGFITLDLVRQPHI
jgi:hypothetical protein